MDRFPPVGGKQLGDIRLHIGQSVGAEICAVSGTSSLGSVSVVV